MTLIDANVLIDLFTNDAEWADWSREALLKSAGNGRIGINPIIYAEVSIAFTKPGTLDKALAELELIRCELPYEAGFRAGKAFLQYRRRQGTKHSPLPDFYIGAHAEIAEFDLLTRDTARYASYFPKVKLISP
ncbi:MAG TPA: type II toxin-antitoxin system VapC family toxin [Opitutales bacterium]|nr:type II toxin-antitoxin system VapC family toxin [Opitutales bacterium]